MKNFQPDEFHFHMCSCTYEIQPDEFSPRGWKSQFQLIENFHQNFTQKNFIWVKKFNLMKFIWLTQRKYQLLLSAIFSDWKATSTVGSVTRRFEKKFAQISEKFRPIVNRLGLDVIKLFSVGNLEENGENREFLFLPML